MRAIRLQRPDESALDTALDEARRAELTSSHEGATLHRPEGSRSWSIALPPRPDPFDAAADALRSFVPHRDGAAAIVHPPRPDLDVGSTFVVAIPFGLFYVVSPLRIVAVVDEADRFGFAYGTVTGHPLRGEEGFLVQRRADRRVTFDVVSLSVASGTFRLGAPLVGVAQATIARRYLRAVAAAVIGRAP